MDCHADKSARNDKSIDSCPPQDSKICDVSKNTPAQTKSQAAGFCDDFCGCQDVGKGAHLRCVTADHSADSTNCARKPTPRDFRIFDEKSGLFKEGQGRALEVRNRRPSAEIALLSQKAESPRLVFISNTCFGMHNFRLHALRALRDEGYAIHIIAPHDSSTPKLTSEGFICHHIRLDSRSLNPCKDLRTAMSLFSLLRRIRPALIFNYTIKPAIYGSLIARGLKIPYIAVITGLGYVFINDRGEASSPKKKLLRFLVCALYRKALKNAKEVWFLNRDDRGEFLTRRLITQEQARLLPSEGVDTAHFAPSLKSDTGKDTDKSTDKEGGQNEECFTFLLIARMLWDKGVGEFVEAAQILRNEIKQDSTNSSQRAALKLRFILLGSVGVANPSAISREIIAQWEAQGLVEYLGEASDVRPYIESASCVVLPSYREGAPMVLLESMSMGKPIITTDVSGCRECIAPPLTPLPLIQALPPFTPLAPLQALAPFAPHTAQNHAQDSHSSTTNTQSAETPSCHCEGAKRAQQSTSQTPIDSMDCHDSASAESRNDKKNTQSQSPTNTPEDSRISKEAAQNLFCEEKSGLSSDKKLTLTGMMEDSRIFDEAENAQAQAKLQNSKICNKNHAPTETLRDSRIFDEAKNTPARGDFEAKNGALRAEARELPQAVMAEAEVKRSPFLVQKPPRPKKAESRILLGANGVLIPAHSSPSLAQAMRAMLKLDSHARNKLGANARELALRHHDKRLITHLYLHTAQKHAFSLPPKQP